MAWVSPSCPGGGNGFPQLELLRARLRLCPVSLFQAQSPRALVPCGVVPAQRDVPVPVPAAEHSQPHVSARVGALGHAGPGHEAPGERCGCWTGKAVLQSEPVRVSRGSPEQGLQLWLRRSWDLPLQGLAVCRGGEGLCRDAGRAVGTAGTPNTDRLLPTATLSSPTAVPSVPASPADARAVAPSSATTAGSPGTPTAPVPQRRRPPAWPTLQHS